MAYFEHFEIDIISALSSQLLEKFAQLESAPLEPDYLNRLDSGQGVYQLYQKGTLVYVGKADSLKRRLSEHREKILGRKNILVSEMSFRCLYVHKNWTALAPESSLIKHYALLDRRTCSWNGIGFGNHDPGRERDTTDKPSDGFDVLYPIREDWACNWISRGQYDAFDLLKTLKAKLPYLLRFEMAAKQSRDPHPSLAGVVVEVPEDGMTAVELLLVVARHLDGWQATVFPSHMIIYKENRHYPHGRRIWPS